MPITRELWEVQMWDNPTNQEYGETKIGYAVKNTMIAVNTTAIEYND